MSIKQMGYKSPSYQKNDEHYSPAWIFEKLGVVFDLDVCGPIGGLEWIPAKRTFSLEDNGLEQNWFGLVWMNPPYSKTTPWVEKWLAHNNGIALLPITATRWFRRIWVEADCLVIPNERIKFRRLDGTTKYIIWETVLVGVGYGSSILKKSEIGRVR